jgi:hypothetical protein
MKTFNDYSVAYFLSVITRQAGEPLQENHPGFLGRYLSILILTSLASIAVAGSVPTHSEAPAVPVAISLNSVTAISTSDVWAVGNGTDSQDPDNTDPAFEHWDGSQWILVPGDRTFEDQEIMMGSDAAGPDDVWAVGSVGQRFLDDRQIEIQHWDGTSWSFVPADQVSINNVLDGVAVVSTNDVWAVGSKEVGGGGRDHSLIEHWNGTRWRAVPIPDPPGADFLHKVAVVSANDVWAVGTYAPNLQTLPLAMHWNGATWSIVPVPAHPTLSTVLTDVVALASNDVWAVGSAFDPTIPSRSRTFIVHWDGRVWTRIISPDTGRFNADGFATVTAIAPNDIWAVGNYVDNGEKTLTEHWNGTAWSILPAPPSFSMNDAAAVASDDVWAVGWMISSSIIQHWDGSSWSVVPSP